MKIMHYYLEEAQTITLLHLIYRPLYVVLSGHIERNGLVGEKTINYNGDKSEEDEA